jgi:hypothetical protein
LRLLYWNGFLLGFFFGFYVGFEVGLDVVFVLVNVDNVLESVASDLVFLLDVGGCTFLLLALVFKERVN